jgi:hypothetical protein
MCCMGVQYRLAGSFFIVQVCCVGLLGRAIAFILEMPCAVKTRLARTLYRYTVYLQ